MSDDFGDYCKRKSDLKQLALEQIIDDAESVGGVSEFTRSCSSQLKRKGFLTDNQIRALKDTRPPNRFSRDDESDEDYDDFFGGPF